MKSMRILLLAAMSGHVLSNFAAADNAQPVTVGADGTVRVSELAVPLSSYMSHEAKQSFIDSVGGPMDPAWSDVNATIKKLRELSEGPAGMGAKFALQHFPVNVEEQRIGGVPARVITPKEGVALQNKNRVLVELHGGGFFTGAYGQAMLDSIPVSAVGRYKVIAVDFRQGPEHQFPAASEDVAAVYKALLKEYDPSNIGIYGCSTGGSLTAMSMAWFQKHQLPRPGAIGIYSAGAFAGFEDDPQSPGAWGGDSRYIAPGLVGEPLWPIDANDLHIPAVTKVYLETADRQDPLVSPGLHPEVLSRFPPTLVLTGTRSWGMSAAIQTHRELVKAGVDSDLHVWDGHGHCFYYDFALPESNEAFMVMAKFFDKWLGR